MFKPFVSRMTELLTQRADLSRMALRSSHHTHHHETPECREH